jgi:5-formyltetrahydrofolate cyclo-ligase
LVSKDFLRKEMKHKLQHLTTDQWMQKSFAVSLNIKTLLTELNILKKEKWIGVYAPFQKEPDWTFSFQNAKGVPSFIQDQLAFPTIKSEGQEKLMKMIFTKSRLSDLVLKDDFGVKILGPRENNVDTSEAQPNIFLIPGLAFGIQGERLGRGKGFYDCYLSTNKGIKIGVCFSEQLSHKIPMDEFDIRMNFIVTDNEIIKIEV